MVWDLRPLRGSLGTLRSTYGVYEDPRAKGAYQAHGFTGLVHPKRNFNFLEGRQKLWRMQDCMFETVWELSWILMLGFPEIALDPKCMA